jgi:hypothetical protein
MPTQREKQPRLVRFTLTRENHEALIAELQRRQVLGIKGADGMVLNEWVARGRGAAAPAPPPPTAPAEPEASAADDDDLAFDVSKL